MQVERINTEPPLTAPIMFEYEVLEQKEELPEGVILRLGGVGQRIDEKNKNGRIYSKRLWEKIFNDEGTLRRVAEREMLGEADHPDTGKTSIPRVSHIVTKMERRGSEIYVEMDVVGTPMGKAVKALVDAKAKIGVSSRGAGNVVERNGNKYVDEDDFQLDTFDIVTGPSTRGAYPAKLESATEDNAKIILETMDALVNSDASPQTQEEVKGIVSSLETTLYRTEKDKLLERLEISESSESKQESEMDALKAAETIEELARAKVEKLMAEQNKKFEAMEAKVNEAADKLEQVRTENDSLREKNAELRVELRKLREQEDGEDDDEEMPEKKGSKSEKRKTKKSEQDDMEEPDDDEEMDDEDRPKESLLRRHKALKRVAERMDEELGASKKLITAFVAKSGEYSEYKEKFEASRKVIAAMLDEKRSAEVDAVIESKLDGYDGEKREAIKEALGRVRTAEEAEGKIDKLVEAFGGPKGGGTTPRLSTGLPGLRRTEKKTHKLAERTKDKGTLQEQRGKKLTSSIVSGVEKKLNG